MKRLHRTNRAIARALYAAKRRQLDCWRGPAVLLSLALPGAECCWRRADLLPQSRVHKLLIVERELELLRVAQQPLRLDVPPQQLHTIQRATCSIQRATCNMPHGSAAAGSLSLQPQSAAAANPIRHGFPRATLESRARLRACAFSVVRCNASPVRCMSDVARCVVSMACHTLHGAICMLRAA